MDSIKGCACFAPGEAPGTCPGRENCPIENDGDECDVCGGEGSIYASEGDASDWGEDTYAGLPDDVIECRHCNGTGAKK